MGLLFTQNMHLNLLIQHLDCDIFSKSQLNPNIILVLQNHNEYSSKKNGVVLSNNPVKITPM
jgi:hypothetical protein